jgi:ADP-ribosylglycohydrolase
MNPTKRHNYATLAVNGLRTGEAFATRLLGDAALETLLDERIAPSAPWPTGHLTALAQNALHTMFTSEPLRPETLSIGLEPNTCALIGLPLGAYLYDDPATAADLAEHTAALTAADDETCAAAAALAASAAWAVRIAHNAAPQFATLLDLILPYMPESWLAWRLARAADLSPAITPPLAEGLLGNGPGMVTATAFSLWCANSCLRDYEAALWMALSAPRATPTCAAITGAVVALAAGPERLVNWLAKCVDNPMEPNE